MMNNEALLGLAVGGTALSLFLAASDTSDPLIWSEITWPREMDHDAVIGLLRSLASDRRSPRLAFEFSWSSPFCKKFATVS